jgi:hypothetical protein
MDAESSTARIECMARSVAGWGDQEKFGRLKPVNGMVVFGRREVIL